jgi:UDP-glucose 6-dehydrogenase
MLGLAFKPGTDDLRDAPAVDVAEVLLAAGALVVAHDPVVKAVPSLHGLHVVGDPYDVVERADAVVLMTDWPAYRDLDLDIMRASMRGSLFLDARNVFDPRKALAAGLAYEGIGRRTSPGTCP